jgi:hypothetical protein
MVCVRDKRDVRATQTHEEWPPMVRNSDAAGVNLDAIFRKQSKARTVAERLLTGKSQTRADLVKDLDLSMTTVPRVVEALEAAGVRIERKTDRTRQAVYRVIDTPVSHINDSEVGHVVARFTHSAGEPVPVSITKVEVVSGHVWVEWSWEMTGTYRGRLLDTDGQVSIPATLLSGNAEIVALTLMSSGQVGIRIGDDISSVLVSDIRPLTAPPLAAG